MLPLDILDTFRIRSLTRAVATFALGFSVSQSDIDAIGSTLSEIRDRGNLRCGVDTNLPGFATEGRNGSWTGFEVDLCRAYAAAFLGSPDDVEFIPLTTAERFEALAGGQVDILVRNTSWTFARGVEYALTFAGIYYYDGQGFMVPSDLGITSVRELDSARICVQGDTTTALNLTDYAEAYQVAFTPVEVETADAGLVAYENGECDAYTNDVSSLAGIRQSLSEPDRHTVLSEVISKEPLGPVVRSDDPEFAEAVRWVLFALIAAEEYQITADTAADLKTSSPNPEVRRLLGAEESIGESLQLDSGFAFRAIETTGHYGELFERHLGEDGLGLERGLNRLWSDGGLLYAPPFR